MNIAGFFKIFGLVLAGFVGLFAVIISYLFATGGFKPAYIPPEVIAFEYQEYIIDEDTEIFIYPTPDNATELDIELRIITGNSIISVPENAKIGEPILIEVLKNELDKNIGGVARIRASLGGLLLAETKILVDVPVDEFTINSSNPGNLYVGNTFTVSPANIFPTNSLNPSSASFPMPNKVVKYYSSHPGVATVNELSGLVTTVGEGVFTIEARVIKTYNLLEVVPNPLDFEYEEDYWAEMDLISTVVTRQFTVSSIAVAGIQTNDNQEDPLYELYLHQTYIYTPSMFGLKLLPQQDSSFTSEQLSYKLTDLTILISNENVLEVVQLESPTRYQIKVLNFETWQIQRTRITFIYEDEFNIFEATVHFKVLRNDVEDIIIEKNTPGAIEVLLKQPNPETYDLQAKTTIVAENTSVAPTYTKLIYRVDLAHSRNELNQLIIDIDITTGYVKDNIITPLNRGTTRLKALIVQTNIDEEAVLDEFGNYIIMFEMPEYVTVNVLEQLTEIMPVKFKKPKSVNVIVGETLQIEATNLSPQQLQDYSLNNIQFIVSDPNKLQLVSYELVGSTLTATYLTTGTGTVNVFITNTTTKMFIDYMEVIVISGEAAVNPVLFTFDLNKTLEIIPPPTPQDPDPAPIISMIRGTEAFLTFDPNSYGAFVDAYRYGKLILESTNPNLIQIYTSIDDNNNIIIKLYAVGFDLNKANSFSMIRISLSTALPNTFLLNEKVFVDLGAVNGIHLSVNSQNIEAVPEVGGTQWLTPLGEILKPTVTFSNPDEPAITGVQFISSDTSILEIDETQIDANGIPRFVFKKAGSVTLTVKSLDEYAKPTDTNHPELGAYHFVTLNVTTPNVVTKFVYTNSVDASVNPYTKIIAVQGFDLLELIDVSGENKPRIKIERSNGVDYTPLAQFELIGVTGVAALTETPENTTLNIPRRLNLSTNEIGSTVLIRIRVFTDFGFEAFYDIQVVPNISSTITHKGGSSPEYVYPPSQLRLLEVQDGVRRVLITKRNGDPINNLQFELSNYNAASISDSELGVINVWNTAVEREVEIRIFIEFASGVNFETFYYITIRPNIEIELDYSNGVLYNGNIYEQINYVSTYNLVLNSKVAAFSIVPADVNITDTLWFSLSGNNPYVSITDNKNGVLSIAPITQDQYIIIRIFNEYDYEQYYYIKIKA